MRSILLFGGGPDPPHSPGHGRAAIKNSPGTAIDGFRPLTLQCQQPMGNLPTWDRPMTGPKAMRLLSHAPNALRRILRVSVCAVLGTILLFAILLIGCQRRLIYFPRRYDRNYARMLPKGTVELTFQTSGGRQTAFYLPPQSGREGLPPAVWLFFGGNAACALDWLDWLESPPLPEPGWLLIEYPGYGLCEGKPSAKNILESTESAVDRLAEHLHVERSAFEPRLCLLGHSIGAAAALQFAARHPVRRVILISPFTSLRDMARRVVGWPLCNLLWDRYDNRARLSELAARAPRPSLAIFHGQADEIVPVKMGRELAGMGRDWIAYQEIAGADHNLILMVAEQQVFAAMRAGG